MGQTRFQGGCQKVMTYLCLSAAAGLRIGNIRRKGLGRIRNQEGSNGYPQHTKKDSHGGKLGSDIGFKIHCGRQGCIPPPADPLALTTRPMVLHFLR